MAEYEDGLSAALAFVAEQQEDANDTQVTLVGTDWEKGVERVSVNANGQEREVERPLKPVARVVVLESVESLIGYVIGPCAAGVKGGAVMVSDKEVVADLAYGCHFEHRAVLPLASSEEFVGLQQMRAGVGARALWTLLVGTLDGCVSPAGQAEDVRLLETLVANITVDDKDVQSQVIDRLGGPNVAGERTVRVSLGTTHGPQGAEIPVSWTWKGRIWSCLEEEFEVPLRLEVGKRDNEITLTFHARRFSDVLRGARAALVSRLGTIPEARATVYEGAFRGGNRE